MPSAEAASEWLPGQESPGGSRALNLTTAGFSLSLLLHSKKPRLAQTILETNPTARHFFSSPSQLSYHLQLVPI